MSSISFYLLLLIESHKNDEPHLNCLMFEMRPSGRGIYYISNSPRRFRGSLGRFVHLVTSFTLLLRKALPVVT